SGPGPGAGDCRHCQAIFECGDSVDAAGRADLPIAAARVRAELAAIPCSEDDVDVSEWRVRNCQSQRVVRVAAIVQGVAWGGIRRVGALGPGIVQDARSAGGM